MGSQQLEYWIVPHTHWDREWYLTFQDFRWKLVKIVDEVLDTLTRESAFAHFMLDGQTVIVDDYLELRPERREELEALVREGRIAVGPWLVQPDDILASGEALIRNLEAGLARARELGGGMMVGHLPDSFGHAGSLPSILRGFGIETACLMRGPAQELDRVLFGWTAKDGSRLLVANLIDGYGNGADLTTDTASIDEGLAESKAKQAAALFPGLPLLVMDGFDHRPIDVRLAQAIARSAHPDTVRIGNLEGYLSRAKEYLHGPRGRAGSGSESPAGTEGRGSSAALPEWKGELRSVYRSPINAGCISSRHWIKREDQEIAALLEHRAEPLAALASLFGVPYPHVALTGAWRQLLLNQAHDSICGCSIDAVHEDMKFRYAQARGLAANIVSDAAASLVANLRRPTAQGAATKVSLAVAAVNPGGAREAALLSFQTADSPDRPVLEDAEGRRYPLQLLAATGEPSLFFDEKFAPGQIRFAMGLVRHGEIMTLRVQAAQAGWESEGALRVDLRLSDASVPSGFDWDGWVAEAKPLLEDHRLTAVHAIGRRAGMTTVLFEAPLPAFGVKCFALRESAGGEREPGADRLSQAGPELPREAAPSYRDALEGRVPGTGASPKPPFLKARGRTIENAYFRVHIAPGGTLDLTEKESGVVYRGIGRLVDTGDRGDEYNFDALPGERVIAGPARRLRRPVRIRLVESGPVRATFRVESRYRLPDSLTADRLRRSRHRLDVAVIRWVSLNAASRRVEIRVEVDNRARDHRMRLHFPLPGRCSESEAGGTFEIVRRPARPRATDRAHGAASDLMHEEPTATHPFTGFVGARWAVERDEASGGQRDGLAILARGLREYEILHTGSRSEIAVTLFRSIGWLSRGDLFVRSDQAGPDIETPAAQEIGRLCFECAVTTYHGELAESDLPAQWEDYRSPVEVRPIDAGAAARTDSAHNTLDSLLQIDGEGLCISSLRRTRAGALSLRFYDILGRPRVATLRCAFPLAGARKTRLDGTVLSDLAIDAGRRILRPAVAPYEIVTVELDPAPGWPSAPSE